MKNQLTKVKNFVGRHKEATVVAVLATLAIASQHKALKQHDQFLSEKGLSDEYYSDEE